MPPAAKRPDLDRIEDAATFRDWYWLKAELLAFAREHGLKTTGAKAAIADRIAHYLETGDPVRPNERTEPAARSKFNWAREKLTLNTVITDSYRNGPNTRAFFIREIGPRFRFNIAFMNWMRENTGKTLRDAVEAWRAIDARRKAGEKPAIPKGNQYNRYVRDFFNANPGATMAHARACWAEKRNRPGTNRYEPSDLAFLKTKIKR